MKHIYALAITLVLLAPSSVLAQTRGRRTTTTQRRRPAATSTTRLDETRVNAARLRLADQIKNLTRFIYLYGRFSKDLELTGSQAGSGDAANATRAQLLSSLRGVREGLSQLETEFRQTPGLTRQHQSLSGVAQLAATAEQRAAAGQLDQAGRQLVEVVNQLTNVLLEM